VSNLAAPKLRLGEWRLDVRQWAVLQAALAARGENERLARLLRRRELLPPMRALEPDDNVEDFDCEDDRLNRLLRRTAAGTLRRDAPRLDTLALTDGGRVVAYYATRPHDIVCSEREGPAVRVTLVARFALDARWRSCNPGAAADMFAHLLRTQMQAPPQLRSVAVMGTSISRAAKRFFTRHGARPLADIIDPKVVMVTVTDMEAALRAPP
jgi:hypothetical protein